VRPGSYLTLLRLRAVLADTSAWSISGVLVALAVVAVLGIGGAGALCKLALNCHTGGIDDAKVLRDAQLASRGSPLAAFPRGFRETVVARGFRLPTDFAFLPGGRFLVSEKEGHVYEVGPGGDKRVVLDLSRRIDTYDYRGIITVAASPAFARDRRFYVLYVLKHRKSHGTTVARFSSFRLPRSGGRAVGERVLLGSTTAASCTDVPATADCLPSDLDHDGAEAVFAPDGSVFVATGDGGGYDDRLEPSALAAQNPDSLSGKVLHITPDGRGLPGNPWWNGDPTANRSKVWAVGLRNPFRVDFDRALRKPIVGDVGRRRFEELDVVAKGGNYGWPCFEGTARVGVYEHAPLCRALYARPPETTSRPTLELRHPTANSIVAGVAAPRSFPARYRGAFLFGDWVRDIIWYADLSGARAPHTLATHVPGPVALHVSPNGELYYLALNSGDLRRITPP
jgi:glucose/arabinose dehydrogenase